MPTISQTFTVNHPKALVWEKFQDLPLIVQCIPGASLDEPPVDGKAKGRLSIKLGPVKADFGGEATVAADSATQTGVITGVGIDKKNSSRAKGEVNYRLEDANGGQATRVVVDVDYTLSGTLAQFARGGIVEAVADQICQDFTANLEGELNASAAPVASAPQPDAAALPNDAAPTISPTRPATQPAPQRQPRKKELNVLSLLWAVLKSKVKGLFSRA